MQINSFLKKKIYIYEYNYININLFLNNNFQFGSILGIDPNRVSLTEFKEIKKNIFSSSSTLIPFKSIFFSNDKSLIPDFKKSLIFSLPKTHIPRTMDKNILYIQSKIKKDAILIWDNSHIAYLLNIRSFELNNSTKPFAGLLIRKKGKHIILSNNPFMKTISKFTNHFDIMPYHIFIKKIKTFKLQNIEVDFNKINLTLYQSLKFSSIEVSKTLLNLSHYISIKTKNEISNINKAQYEDGLALIKFILFLKTNNINNYNEHSLSNVLQGYRKNRVNFFRNSFDYISAFDGNASKIHYKPKVKTSMPFKNSQIYLIDSGGHYLEGTTDVTRVIALNKIPLSIKNYYTYILKSLIDIESKFFKSPLIASKIDNYIRSMLKHNNVTYGHGTGHGVGFFNDVHERPPTINATSKDVIKNNQLFSLEPGYYVDLKFGLRLENLYFSKLKNNKISFENTTLVPYDIQMINVKLLNSKEINFINNYHKKILQLYATHLSELETKLFTKSFLLN